jgi:hypothetical protein
LAVVARRYHQNQGVLGQRLAEFALAEQEIEISLHDASLSAVKFSFEDCDYTAIAHVKVDDAKSPDKCGRIYFAIDEQRHRFIVDHIGHDYG